MTALLPLLIMARLTWVVHDVPNLEPSGQLTFRLADIDGDGLPDLVFANKVFFHTGSPFNFAAGVDLPKTDKIHPGIDVFGQTIYERFPDRLRAFQWKDRKWETVIDQSMAWPSSSQNSEAHFERYLYDLNTDEIPELLIAGEDGIHVFQIRDGQYQDVARWDVFPRPAIERGEPQALWPPEARQVAFPDKAMACRFSVERKDAAACVTVIANEPCGEKKVRFRVKRCFFNAEDFAPLPERNAEEVSQPMPAFMHPRRLGTGDRIDYAGGDWEFSENSILPEPIFETCASTDAGKTIQRFRTTSFRPQCSFMDFNGDGRLDIVTESTGCFSGGVRETISRFLTSRTITHDVAVHLQSPDGIFSKTPNITAHFRIELDEPPLRGSALFRQYETGELVDVTGDFNGDGKRDILVHDKPHSLSVYLQKDSAFSDKPDATIEIEAEDRVQVADVDGDGRSDVVVYGTQARIFFSREEP